MADRLELTAIQGSTARMVFQMQFDVSEQALTATARIHDFEAVMDVRTLFVHGVPLSAGLIELSSPASETASWPKGILACSVRAEIDGEVSRTRTFFIRVIEGGSHG